MKLRNKKTGEIKEYTHTMTSYHVPIKGGYEIFTPWYPEEWEELEDVKEPLIKDEKIRKVVRAWAEANKEEELEVMGGCSVTAFKSLYNHTEIDFNCSWKLRDSVYTIEELCGEEK